jgi:hypothetical protein
MRSAFLVTSTILFCTVASLGYAADLTAPRQKTVVAPQAAPAEATCLRWVEQTYSWYNYCDPVPYSPRQKYSGFAGLF